MHFTGVAADKCCIESYCIIITCFIIFQPCLQTHLLLFYIVLTDARFPEFTKVEFVFSQTPDRLHGSDYVPGSNFPVDNSDDPLIRWDSYENFETTIDGGGRLIANRELSLWKSLRFFYECLCSQFPKIIT